MNAYYIDPVLEFVAEVNYSGDYKDIYKWIQARTFDVVNINGYGDGLYVDDEGMLKEKNHYFSLPVYRGDEYQQETYAGRAIIIGVDGEGDSDQVKGLSFPLLKDRVQWHGMIHRDNFNIRRMVQ